MILLADAHRLLWLSNQRRRVPRRFIDAVAAAGDGEAIFSAVSVWEVAIKERLGRVGFNYDAGTFRLDLLGVGWRELAVTGAHAVAVADLPAIDGDPFDRLLVAQAVTDGLTLFTSDAAVARYGGAIELV